MIPASFAPMIAKLVMPKIMDHFMKVFKLEKIIKYFEQPNDADRLGEKNQEHITMIAGEISGLEDRLNKLEILSGKAKKVKSDAK